MTHEELYAGLPKEQAAQWRKFAQEKWPEQVAHGEKMLLKTSKEEFKLLQEGFKANMEALTQLRHLSPEGVEVQKEIAKHYGYIQQFWGRCENIGEAYKGLGQLYVDDPSYTTIAGKPDKDLAVFMRDAIRYYAENNL